MAGLADALSKPFASGELRYFDVSECDAAYARVRAEAT